MPDGPTLAAAPPPSELVDVVNPRGELTRIAKDDLPAALDPKAGYRVPTPEELGAVQSDKSAYQRATEKGHSPLAAAGIQALHTGLGGDFGEAWREGAIEGATGGLGQAGIALALDAVDKKYADAYKKNLAEVREASPTTRMVGNIGGEIARDVVLGATGLGTLSGLAETGIARAGVSGAGVLSKAARAATGLAFEGGITGAAQELSEESLGDNPQLNAEKILMAGGQAGLLGAAFGGGGSLAASGLKAGAKAAGGFISNSLATHADGAQKLADEMRYRAIDANAKYTRQAAEKGTHEYGAVMRKYGIGGQSVGDALEKGTPGAILDDTAAAKEAVGRAIGEVHGAKVALGDILDQYDHVIAKTAEEHGSEATVAHLERLKDSLASKLAKNAEQEAGSLKFEPHPVASTSKTHTTVMVDAKALDKAWSLDHDYYIPPGGGGAEIAGRRQAFEAFQKSGEPIQASRVSVDPKTGVASFTDGRHRFSVLRDQGVERVPITIEKADAKALPASWKATDIGDGTDIRKLQVPIQDAIAQRKVLDGMVWKQDGFIKGEQVNELKAIRGRFEDQIVASIDKAAKEAGDPAGAAKLLELKDDYSKLSHIENAAEKSRGSYKSNNLLGLGSQMVGATALASGHGVLAAPMAFGAQYLKARGNALGAVMLDKMADLGAAQRAIKAANERLLAAAKGVAGSPYRGAIPAPKESLRQRYSAALEHVSKLSAEQGAVAERVAARPIANAPNTTGAMSASVMRALNYLVSKVPPNIARHTPGMPKQEPRASEIDMNRFVTTYEAVTNPGQVLDNLAAGRVRRAEVDAIRNTSPEMFAELQQKALDDVMAKEAAGKPLSLDQRLKLGIVLDIPTDPSLQPDVLSALQTSLASAPEPEQNGKAGPKAPRRPINIQSEPSGLDRIEARG